MTTNRSELVGGYVTPEVKDALRERAAKERTSVSRMIYRILKKVLKVTDAGEE